MSTKLSVFPKYYNVLLTFGNLKSISIKKMAFCGDKCRWQMFQVVVLVQSAINKYKWMYLDYCTPFFRRSIYVRLRRWRKHRAPTGHRIQFPKLRFRPERTDLDRFWEDRPMDRHRHPGELKKKKNIFLSVHEFFYNYDEDKTDFSVESTIKDFSILFSQRKNFARSSIEGFHFLPCTCRGQLHHRHRRNSGEERSGGPNVYASGQTGNRYGGWSGARLSSG